MTDTTPATELTILKTEARSCSKDGETGNLTAAVTARDMALPGGTVM